MPSTGYDRDSERIGLPRGPRWHRVLALAVFLLSVVIGAFLASLAKGQGNAIIGGALIVIDGDTVEGGRPEL
jgi:hypothetical protein